VDEQLAMLVQKAYRPCVLIVNKWDLVQGRKNDKGRPIGPGDYESYLRAELKGLDFAPVSFVSAETGLNLRETLGLAFEIQQQAKQRVTTGQLNRLVAAILERSNPPSKLGTRAKCYYVAQVKVSPPTIVMVVNKPELFTNTYCRFLLNRFREAFPFGEVPIRLLVRARSRTLMRKGRGGVEPVADAELTQEEIAEVESEATAAAGAPAGDDAETYFEDE
jgi:GTP-binding protein